MNPKPAKQIKYVWGLNKFFFIFELFNYSIKFTKNFPSGLGVEVPIIPDNNLCNRYATLLSIKFQNIMCSL